MFYIQIPSFISSNSAVPSEIGFSFGLLGVHSTDGMKVPNEFVRMVTKVTKKGL